MPEFIAVVEWKSLGTVVVDADDARDAKDKLYNMEFDELVKRGVDVVPDSMSVNDVEAALTIKDSNGNIHAVDPFGWLMDGVDVTVDLSDLHDLSVDEFLDMISDRAGFPLLQQQSYTIVGHRGTELTLRVMGNVEAHMNEDDDREFRNFYRCPMCDNEWDEVYTATCDSECGECGLKHISPYKSEDVEG